MHAVCCFLLSKKKASSGMAVVEVVGPSVDTCPMGKWRQRQ
jgi:hypothetical protein